MLSDKTFGIVLMVAGLVLRIHCSWVTILENVDGDRSHNIRMAEQGGCTSLLHYHIPGNIIKSIRVPYGSNCVKIWQFAECRGHYRCICDTDKIVNLNNFTISSEIFWTSVGVQAVSSCDFPDPVEASVWIYEYRKFSGGNTIMQLHKDKCETFYSGDIWADRVSSLRILRGCVQYYTNRNCIGGFSMAWKNESFNNPEAYIWHIGKNWNDRARSMRTCPTSEDDFDNYISFNNNELDIPIVSHEEEKSLPTPTPFTLAAPMDNSTCEHAYEYTAVDCHTYFTCVDFRRKEYHQCPKKDELAFNAVLGVCDLAENVEECSMSSSSAEMEPTTMRSDESVSIRNCKNEYRPHTEDCRKFYFCRNSCHRDNESVEQEECEERTCPDGLLWSVDVYGDASSHQQCTLPNKATCAATDPTVAFTCTDLVEGDYVNELNCRSFWRCVEGRALLYNCPRGFLFDPKGKKCELAGKNMKYCQVKNL